MVMEELIKPKHPDKTKISLETQIKKGAKRIGTLKRIQRGHKIFIWDEGTVNEVRSEDYSEPEIQILSNKKTRRFVKIQTKSNCYYTSALNLKNAIKKFRRLNLLINNE